VHKSNGILVTIGLCTKNSEKTIAEAVCNIVAQDFPHKMLEVIIVDGKSQDATLSIISQYLSKTAIKATFFSESTGLGFARQVVVNNAAGKYIVWVDGDILLSKDYIRRQVEFMEENPSAAISVGRFGLLHDDNWIATLENVGYVLNSLRHVGGETKKLIGAEAAIFRTESIRNVGGFNCNIKGAQEDCDLAYRIKKAGWSSYMIDAVFCERQKSTWKELWKQHFWYGYGLHFLTHSNKNLNMVTDKTVDRIVFSSDAYRLTHRKTTFLLPLNFVFKKTALLLGFMSAHMNGYGHVAQSDSSRHKEIQGVKA
jgi:glycosyltransferase involved in cell wall biosynthesis